MPYYVTEQRRRTTGLRDHHTHRRAFKRKSDAQLASVVEDIIEA